MKPFVAIYRTVYFLSSEAFIPSQMLALKQYRCALWCRDLILGANYGFNGFNVENIRAFSGFFGKLAVTAFGCLRVRDTPLLIHAHFGPDAAMIMPFAKRNNIPLIVTMHGIDVQQSRWRQVLSGKLSNWLFLLREKSLYDYASKVVVVSEYLKIRLLSRGCPAEKIEVIYIGTDIQKFNIGRHQRFRFRLVNVSRHVDWKGIDTILKALSILVREFPAVQLIQIGSGSETEKLKSLARELNVERHVEWRGSLCHQEVVLEMQRAELYVHAARYDKNGQTEAFGISLIEAQACGLPVVSTNSGGIAEAVSFDCRDFLVEENDYIDLANKVRIMLLDSKKTNFIGLSARSFVCDYYDINKCTLGVERLYNEVLGKIV
ncbi:glycosyltransferase [Methylococcaceae bacterium WWC4]|nr:glycosyltransferase [Methylococcaceae bacterium WWC4]